ncbi:HEAT repeat domain-containing protein, partial [Streptomyces atratus]
CRTALQSLARHFGDRPDTLTLLTDRATNDPHEDTRDTALQSLAEHFGDRPDTLTLLTDRATNDPHEDTRRTALQSLARHFGDRPDTLTLLTDRATSDPHPRPRGTAFDLLTERFAGCPETRTFLARRAVNGATPHDRLQAFRAWAALLPAENVYEVGTQAIADPHPLVRAGGTWILALGCLGNLQAKEQLSQCVRDDSGPDVRGAASDALAAVQLLAAATAPRH